MDLQDLRVFVAVCRGGSFGRAAQQLHHSQPSISLRIAGLERSLGARLFDRDRRGVTLTAAGERLATYASQVLDLADHAAAAVRAAGGVERFSLGVHGA